MTDTCRIGVGATDNFKPSGRYFDPSKERLVLSPGERGGENAKLGMGGENALGKEGKKQGIF